MLRIYTDKGLFKEFTLDQIEILDWVQTHSFEYIELYANNLDLDTILQRFNGIPVPRQYKPSFTWYGNIAKTILANL